MPNSSPAALASTVAPVNDPEPKSAWFDAGCAILMAAATLSTAWCSYQNSRWSGRTTDLQQQADVLGRQAMAMVIESQQFESAQLQLEMKATDAILAGDDKPARFYTTRFPAELKPAWDQWMALKPFENPAAPPHPFVPQFYKPRFADQIRDAQATAGRASSESKATALHAAGYLSNTVLLATVLFFAGTAGKFDERRVRQPSLAFAVALFLFAAVRMILLPVG
jgi:hypothetical protein